MATSLEFREFGPDHWAPTLETFLSNSLCIVTPLQLERFPIRLNHLIEKDSLRFKELEHVLIEKIGQPFRNML